MSANQVVVPLRPGSDGDPTHIPSGGQFTQVTPPTLFLEKIALQWMVDRGEDQTGVRYVLETLPAGYTMWQRRRSGTSNAVDKYLFGHPRHKRFDSPNRFYPHFKFLMENGGSSIGCPCTVCAVFASSTGSNSRPTLNSVSHPTPVPTLVLPPTPVLPASVLPPASTSVLSPTQSPQPPSTLLQSTAHMNQARPKLTCRTKTTVRPQVDEEGTLDVYEKLVTKLKQEKIVNVAIEEPWSPDWLAEQKLLPKLLQELADNEQWKPRKGELLLFLRDLEEGVDITQVKATGEYQLYNRSTNTFLGIPSWEAGVVTETPTTNEFKKDQHKGDSVIYYGLRVEPLPNPNHLDKSLSKRYKYVSLRQTRPFFLWYHFMKHLPQDKWHPTILNALSVSATLSFVGKYRFAGIWPNATIFTHALYLGYELLSLGDTIRLLPISESGRDKCVEIMVVKSIQMRLTKIHEHLQCIYPFDSRLYFSGIVYTSIPSDSSAVEQFPRAAAGYSKWYLRYPPGRELQVRHNQVLGRLYEHRAMQTFLDSEDDDMLDAGRRQVNHARVYSACKDQRNVKSHRDWFWGDSRAESLAITSFNGLDVAQFDQLRDIKDLRKKTKILEPNTKNEAAKDSRRQDDTLGSKSRGLRSFTAPDLPPTPGRSNAFGTVDDASKMSGNSRFQGGRKRDRAASSTDEDIEDDDIHRSTVVAQESTTQRKRSTVKVVISK